MLISKDSQIFHSLAVIASGKTKYSDKSESILLQDFCDTVRLCYWLGIEVREAPEIKEKIIDAGHKYFDYHLQNFDEWCKDMVIIDEIMNDELKLSPKQNSKVEWETKINQSKTFLAMIHD
jgi:hypothetical protein